MVFYWDPKSVKDSMGPRILRNKESIEKLFKEIFGSHFNEIKPFERIVANLIDSKVYSAKVFTANQYHHKGGKVVLAGDAAHTMSANLGQVHE